MSHRPTDEDDKLWKHVTKGIKPYHPSQEPAPLTPSSETINKKKVKVKKTEDFIPIKVSEPKNPAALTASLDKRTETRLKRGQIKIEGRIDLHGMTMEQAHDSLVYFIQQSIMHKRRCVLVITGKGRLSAPGKIKQNIAHWLYDFPLGGMVLRHVTAQPADGGSGAFYVYLKRQKE